MSEKKYYTIIKVIPNNVLFDLHPLLNSQMTRHIFLTNSAPKQILPLEWALGVFQDPDVYNMYKKGYFTFDDNESIVKDAFEAGVYFGEELDFTPAKANQSGEILEILKAGNRANILKAIDNYGKDVVKDVAITYVDNLTQGVISMLENVLNTQLVLD